MCGITGFTGPHNRTALELMTECLRHRGPDAARYWEGPDVSLGMRRLAIHDVGQANSRCYNYVELREALQRGGRARWRTSL